MAITKIEYEKREKAIELPNGTVLDVPERTKANDDKIQAVLNERTKMKEYDLQQRQVDAQIANIRADTAYKQAQRKSISSSISNNPYSNTSSNNNLSKKAQEIYDLTIKTAKAMTTSAGKQRARNSIATKLSQLLNAKVITDNEMQIIADEAFGILENYSGGSGSGRRKII